MDCQQCVSYLEIEKNSVELSEKKLLCVCACGVKKNV